MKKLDREKSFGIISGAIAVYEQDGSLFDANGDEVIAPGASEQHPVLVGGGQPVGGVGSEVDPQLQAQLQSDPTGDPQAPAGEETAPVVEEVTPDATVTSPEVTETPVAGKAGSKKK